MNIDISKLTPTKPMHEVKDSGRVRIGATSPSFPAVRATPACAKDGEKLTMGATSPSFPPVR
jgi:hypothetical protein